LTQGWQDRRDLSESSCVRPSLGDIPQYARVHNRLLHNWWQIVKSARIILMVWPSEDGVVVDGHHIIAPHIVISLEEVKPGAHAIPFLFVFRMRALAAPLHCQTCVLFA
jgi:hypothetical protein